jgi:hypothetical protein
MTKKIAGLFMLLGVCCAVSGQTERDFKFENVAPTGAQGTSPRVTITDYDGRATVVAIPPTLGGVRVSRIGNGAFKDKGLRSVDIPSVVTDIEQEAFAGNQLDIITIGQGVNLGPRSFENNFIGYYNNRGKSAGTYSYNRALSVWQSEAEYTAWLLTLSEEARKRAEAEEAQRRAEEAARRAKESTLTVKEDPPPEPKTQPSYSPSYSSYDSDIDIDFNPLLSLRMFMMAGYEDCLAGGLNLRAGFGISADDFAMNFVGYLEGGLSVLFFFPTWGYGAIGELHFDDFGFGFGTGMAASLAGFWLDGDFTSQHRQYLRGALILPFDGLFDSRKITLYADYFLNSNWRFGVAFHYNFLDL